MEQIAIMCEYAAPVIGLIFVVFLAICSLSRPGYLGDWGKRIRHTFDHGKLPD